ncbi:E3 ubiquitin-protein ligase TRIM39 isoform X2 [Gouania willdenowi]|uniref:E3 ubiquitin-protein ligase TRIM39 isoform X2 n=1 Tax=Gouania willdenowi TaxID=441366 RepID=UPI001056CA27|nr:E3 ubiquitin-protein ligase TRIM39-like isoform X2 [Gouania willdenowi]
MSLLDSFLLSDDQFLCSICLDVFTNPSSTPCGHSFCMGCISRYWDGSKVGVTALTVRLPLVGWFLLLLLHFHSCLFQQVFQCPLCKKTFQKRPELQINRTLREITEQFKSMRGAELGGGGGGRERRGKMGLVDGGIPGNVYDELKKKLQPPLSPDARSQDDSFAAMFGTSVPSSSSLIPVCPSYPPPPPPAPHPHPRSGGRRRFTVSGADSSQNLPLCHVHNRGILIYCKSDHVCVCPVCESEDHHDHDTVTIEARWIETKALLSESELEVQELIKQKKKKMEEIRTSMAELALRVERETAGSVEMFSALMAAIERSQAELMEALELGRRAAEHQAEAMIRQLEEEVDTLRRRESALSELAKSDDHIHCVKTFPSLSTPPSTRDWTGTTVPSNLGTGTIYRSLAAMVDKFQEQLNALAEIGSAALTLEPTPIRAQPRIKKIQEYALDITLDANTAHPRLLLSEDLKSVRCGERHQLMPDNPERFDRVVCVLGREAISCGRHYWEVEVGGKTDWDLGVAKLSVYRKGKIQYTPCNGFWFLSLRDKSKYAFRTEPSTDVHMNLPPNKIGIFVDFEKGQVSFYNVDAKIHIYTFSDIFNECLYPFFSPCTNKSGKNDGPLVITPVSIAE